jgi:hypothetical protein
LRLVAEQRDAFDQRCGAERAQHVEQHVRGELRAFIAVQQALQPRLGALRRA